ncbi:pectate lyase [Pyrenophora tritici-repentis]|nr:pectate lyase [Pyrenophora tritici-repentis]
MKTSVLASVLALAFAITVSAGPAKPSPMDFSRVMKRASFPIPAGNGSETFSAPKEITGVFDGGMKTYGRGVSCTGQAEGGDSDAVFILKDGATLKNAIIGKDQIEGVHCQGSCTIENAWWAAVCEDALTLKGNGNAQVTGGGATGAADKVIQHNGGGTVTISGFTVDTFGKLYRACGNCKTKAERHVVIKGVKATNGKLLAGVNRNFGDTATIDDATCLLVVRKAPSTSNADGLYKAFMIFMLVKLLNLAKKNWKELGSEAIHVVSAKLTRRLRKFALLGQTDCLQPSWRQYIQISITEAHEIVKQHWESLVAHQGNIKITAIATLKPELDLDMKLVGLDDFLNFGHPSSIAVRYFEQGKTPQTELRDIEDDAAFIREEKCAELISLKEMYGKFIDQYNTQERTYEPMTVVEKSPFWNETTKTLLLLLRGLFAGGVLCFIFGQKRYRVNFGLDRSRIPRTLPAIPYKSKDSPFPRSEFSHPDVVIILTLLSWSEYATIHYDDFVSTASFSLPEAFGNLSVISIHDRQQYITQLFPGLWYSRKVVDYFLSYLVFLKQLKQFTKKLSASGWDLAV